MSGFLTSVKRWVLWDHPRGSLHYDVMVALILAFIFLTPRAVFRDQPKPKEVVMLPGENGSVVFWLEPDLLEGYSGAERTAHIRELIRRQAKGAHLQLTRVEPIFDSEEEIKGYMAFAKQLD